MTDAPATTSATALETVTPDKVMVWARESLTQLMLSFEDRDWKSLTGQGSTKHAEVTGLDLDSLKTMSRQLRTWTSAGSLKRATEVRGELFFGDGVGFGKLGRGKRHFESPHNREAVFSPDALELINRAHATDGTVVFLVHRTTRDIERVFIDQLGDPFVDGAYPDRIWYIRRSYNRVTPANPAGETIDEYVPTDMLPKEYASAKVVGNGVNAIPVNQDYVAVPWTVNRHGGWALGMPDMLASLQWAEEHSEYLRNQARFAKALASFAWDASATSSKTAKQVAAALAQPGVGDTYAHTADQELRPLEGASAVSFDNGNPLAALAAANAGITLAAYMGESADGASAGLDPIMRKTAIARRNAATTFFQRIGRLLNAPNLEVIWPNLQAESPYREAQMIVSAWNTGLFEADEVRPALAQRTRLWIEEDSSAPEGVMLPNNEKTLALQKPAPTEEDPDDPDAETDTGINQQGKDALGVGKLSDGDNEARDKGENPA